MTTFRTLFKGVDILYLSQISLKDGAKLILTFLHCQCVFTISLSWVSIAATKHHDHKASRGEKSLFNLTLPHCCSSMKGGQKLNRAGSWRQVLMQRPWRYTAYWLACPGLLSLHSYRTQIQQPRDGTTHHGLDPPHRLLIEKMPYTGISWRHFFN